ncbi:pyrroline-5-carboxylate reductase [Desulfovibrio sp. OttesenSCG-928-G15]|nr:pyrroline-5-carboxylate reductase [Desulfovibrio sp. OttesenSCG-928-G15]
MSMASQTVGIIGYGSMGAALANAMVRSKSFQKSFSLRVYAKEAPARSRARPGIVFSKTLQELAVDCAILIIAVRPEQVASVVRDVCRFRAEAKSSLGGTLVSIAAGVTLAELHTLTADSFSVFRVMPNILVEVGKGLFGLCTMENVQAEDRRDVLTLFSGLGTVIEFDEKNMNAFTALAGCGPGFLFHIMDSLCEAGVSVGLTRQDAQTISAALMDGCASMASVSGKHPVLLREQGTSPAGMTIAGLNHLDRTGVRGHIIDAVKAAFEQGGRMDNAASLS